MAGWRIIVHNTTFLRYPKLAWKTDGQELSGTRYLNPVKERTSLREVLMSETGETDNITTA